MTETIITSSVLILVIILLRYLLRGKISLRLQYALWLAAAIRLLLPFGLLPSPVSVMNVVKAAPWVEQAAEKDGNAGAADSMTFSWGTPAGAEKTGPQDNGQASAATPPGVTSARSLPPQAILTGVWLGGACVALIWMAAANIRFRHKLKIHAWPLKQTGSRLPVYLTPGLPSPCLFGILKPRIYLPTGSFSTEEELRFIIAHEETHRAHLDHLWAYLRCLCLALHWFNPLVWLAAVLSRRDCELACDEGTLRRIGEESRTRYGRMLVGFMTAQKSPTALFVTATTMTSGFAGIRERVRLIAKKPKTLLPALIVVLLVVSTAVGCTFTGARAATSPVSDASVPPSPEISAASASADDTPDISAAGSEALTDTVNGDKAVQEIAQNYIDQVARQYQKDAPQDKPIKITETKLVKLDCIGSFKMMGFGAELWELEYRLKPDNIGNVSLENGATVEDGWITETTGDGKPCLILMYMNDTPALMGVTNTSEISQEGGAENMLNLFMNAHSISQPEPAPENTPSPREWDHTDLEACISEAILSNTTPHLGGSDTAFTTEAHVTLKTVEDGNKTVVYVVANCARFEFPGGEPQSASSYKSPAMLTFEKDSGEDYKLTGYWTPPIFETLQETREKFPSDIATQALGYGNELRDACLQKAEAYAAAENKK